jgi:hypothetical protein
MGVGHQANITQALTQRTITYRVDEAMEPAFTGGGGGYKAAKDTK